MASMREQITALFREAFGPPITIPTPEGLIYRWTLKAAARGGKEPVTLRITIDGPEFSDMAHVILSDPEAFSRLESITMRTLEEARAVIERIGERQRGKPEPDRT